MEFEHREERLMIRVMHWIVDLVAVVCAAFFLTAVLGYQLPVEGRSMEPGIHSGDIVLVDQIRYGFASPKRFDIIGIRLKNENEVVKRIVGMPGEYLRIADGEIYIDGVRLETGGLIEKITVPGLAVSELEIPQDSYFVLGDVTANSEDSRFAQVGFITRSEIIGRVWFRVAGLSDFGFVK